MFFANAGGSGSGLEKATREAGQLTLSGGAEFLQYIALLESGQDYRSDWSSLPISAAKKFAEASGIYRSILPSVEDRPIDRSSLLQAITPFEEAVPAGERIWQMIPGERLSQRGLYSLLANNLGTLANSLPPFSNRQSASDALFPALQLMSIWNAAYSTGRLLSLVNVRLREPA